MGTLLAQKRFAMRGGDTCGRTFNHHCGSQAHIGAGGGWQGGVHVLARAASGKKETAT